MVWSNSHYTLSVFTPNVRDSAVNRLFYLTVCKFESTHARGKSDNQHYFCTMIKGLKRGFDLCISILNKRLLLIILTLSSINPLETSAFWVVNFGTARTIAYKRIGFAAGMGGQMVFLGDPQTASGFFTIPHAGFRIGLGNKLDAGLRLAPIPLPFSSVGPGFGVNIDAKYCFTKPQSKVDFALIAGVGGAHVLIEGNTKLAYSPNGAALVTYNLNAKTHVTGMARYVSLSIPTAPEGANKNFVNISGISIGLKRDIRSNISLLPEIGAYWYDGQIKGVTKAGPGFQYGIMLATSF
jgi:hypothetical protein